MSPRRLSGGSELPLGAAARCRLGGWDGCSVSVQGSVVTKEGPVQAWDRRVGVGYDWVALNLGKEGSGKIKPASRSNELSTAINPSVHVCTL